METNIRLNVMRRVYLVYYTKRFFNSVLAKFLFASICLLYACLFISFGDVVTNMPHATHFYSLFLFAFGAVIGTELVVQIMLAFSVALVSLAVWGIFKNLKSRGDDVMAYGIAQ